MSVQKYFDMIREIKDASFATVGADGKPKVRIIDVMLVEDEKLYFLTARGKEFYNELMTDGQVAIVAMNQNYEMLRFSGKVKNVGQDLLGRIFEENPSMNGVYPGESRNILEVFCLDEGEGEYFNLSKEPIDRVAFTYGKIEEKKKGFLITDECIGCGTCKSVCPQQTIEEGTPFHINQEHCLHCGLCMESCPVDAIRKLG